MKCPPNIPLIHFDGVTLRVDGRDRFRGIQWAVRPGEQWAVLGPNGSGKSTLLQAVLGRVPVSRGEIVYRLDDRNETPDWGFPEDAIGYVSQEEHRTLIRSVIAFHQARWSGTTDHPPLRVRDVILQGKHAIHKRQRAIHALLGLDPLMERGIETLSNGEMRKTLIARALARRPKVLILDAPYAGLDTVARKYLKNLLGQLMRDGLTVLMTVQRPEEIPTSITHLLCMEKRRIVGQGPRKHVLADPMFKAWMTPSSAKANSTAMLPPFKPCHVLPSPIPLVEMKKVTVTYHKDPILSNVNWKMLPGEKWVLRGPNGSGKSTLASLILGDNPQAYSNYVRVFGFLRGHGESLWEIKERIGWIAPELHYHYDFTATCREVVASGLYDTMGVYQDGSAREARQVRRWMHALSLQRWRNELFGALSDGEQRMVLMARALVKEPALLILDEPCQGLDMMHRHTMLALLDALARQPQTTILYITHHLNEIPAAFTHELYLHGGRIIRCGIRRKPITRETIFA